MTPLEYFNWMENQPKPKREVKVLDPEPEFTPEDLAFLNDFHISPE